MLGDHTTFVVTVECIECGWRWEGFDHEAQAAMLGHIREPARIADTDEL